MRDGAKENRKITVKHYLKGDKTMNEEKNFEVNDEMLEGASGGVIFDASQVTGSDPNNPWEVLDDTNGSVLGRFATKTDAAKFAAQNGKNHMTVSWDQVQELRGLK